MVETEHKFDCVFRMKLDRMELNGPRGVKYLVDEGELLCPKGRAVCGLKIPWTKFLVNGQDISCSFETPGDCERSSPIIPSWLQLRDVMFLFQ